MKLKITQKEQKVTFQKEVDRLLEKLNSLDPKDKEYEATVRNLETLCQARSHKNSILPSADTMIAVAANLIGLLVVLNYERTGIITSKAVNFIFKGKS